MCAATSVWRCLPEPVILTVHILIRRMSTTSEVLCPLEETSSSQQLMHQSWQVESLPLYYIHHVTTSHHHFLFLFSFLCVTKDLGQESGPGARKKERLREKERERENSVEWIFDCQTAHHRQIGLALRWNPLATRIIIKRKTKHTRVPPPTGLMAWDATSCPLTLLIFLLPYLLCSKTT